MAPANLGDNVVTDSPDVSNLRAAHAGESVFLRYIHFVCFAGFLAIGVYLIKGNIFQPWASTAVVFSYALLLYLLRSKLPLTGEAKDSAYYLCFSLNLVFLFLAFRNCGS